MVKEHSSIIRKLEILFDLLIMVASANIATLIYKYYIDPRFHSNIGLSFFSSIEALPFYYLSIIFFIMTVLYYLYFDNIYYTQRYFEISTLVKKIFIDVVKSTIIVGIITFIMSSPEFPLYFFLVYSAVSLILIISFRIIIKIFLFKIRRRGINLRQIVILGTKEGIFTVQDNLLPKHKGWGIKINEALDINNKESVEKFESILKTTVVDDIFVSCDSDDITVSPEIKPFLLIAQDFGKSIRIFINPQNYMNFSNSEISFLEEYPTLFFSHKNFSDDALLIKRIIDIIAGITGCFITLAVLPFIAIAIKLDSKGPLFFKQTRIGNNRRPFMIYKFRTMIVDAEEVKKTLAKENEMGGAVFKMKNDPRVTKTGKFLRKFSLDEFPQFFNILKGDMSLVGTRPPTPDEVVNYDSWHHKRISIKPGLTGMWQISGRNSISNFDDIVNLDLKYIDNWSISLDFIIIFKTFRAVFKGY